MPEVTVNGLRLQYVERGTGAAMILLHGLCAGADTWQDTMNHFEGRFRVLAYDARGHGQSGMPDKPDAYSQAIMVQDLADFMEARKIQKAILVGHSMGAGVSLNFALQYPDRCLKLVLVGIGTGCSNPKFWQEWWGRLAELAERQGMAPVLEEMARVPSWRDAFNHPEIGEGLRQTVLRNSPKAIAHVISGIQMKRASIFDLEARLKECPVSTLVVFSESDSPVIECSRFISRCMPNAKLKSLPARSHWTYLEAPVKFLSALDKFLAKVAS